MIITEAQARKVLETVDAGLVRGLGAPVPGRMCVMAAISYALGLSHGDDPESYVDFVVRAGDIALNDAAWSSPEARARGMRREAVAKLGSAGTIDSVRYAQLLCERTIREIVPIALRGMTWLSPGHVLEQAALRCEGDGNKKSAEIAVAAVRAAANGANQLGAAYAVDAAHAATDGIGAVYAAAASDCEFPVVYAAAAAYAAADAARIVASGAARGTFAVTSSNAVLTHMADIMVRCLQDVGSPGCQWLHLAEAA